MDTTHVHVLGIHCRYTHSDSRVSKRDVLEHIGKHLTARKVLRLDANVADWNLHCKEMLGFHCLLSSDPYVAKDVRFFSGSMHEYLIRTVAYGRANRGTLCKTVFPGWPFGSDKTIGSLIDLDPETALSKFYTEWEVRDEDDQVVDAKTVLEFCHVYPSEPAKKKVELWPSPSPAKKRTDEHKDDSIVEKKKSKVQDTQEDAEHNVLAFLKRSGLRFNDFDPSTGYTINVHKKEIFFMIRYHNDRPVADDESIPLSTSRVEQHSPCRLVYIACANRRDALKKALILWGTQHLQKVTVSVRHHRLLNAIRFARDEPFDAEMIKSTEDLVFAIDKLKCKNAQKLLTEYRE